MSWRDLGPCACTARKGIVHKPSGRVICGDCGGSIETEQPQKPVRP